MPRIPTTHTGSLPRPADLTALLAHEGERSAELPARVRLAVSDAVARQARAGIDLISDGEQGKTGYSTYVQERLSGFEGESAGLTALPELERYPDYGARMAALTQNLVLRTPACVGPVKLSDAQAVHNDIRRLKDAAAGARVPDERLFMTAASPGVIAFFFQDQYYGDREDYLGALASAMRPEYEAVVEAGLTLQLDCPDLAMSRHTIFADLDLEAFRREVALNVEALNEAVRGIAPEKMRMHVCWGNYEGPHTGDVALGDILDLVLKARPAGISVEASNPRHAHEWELFRERRLPDGRYLIPGVVDSTTNFVEHPRLVAQRLTRYAEALGRDRVMAGTDCGFGTFAGMDAVAPSIVWAKLAALVEGARLASGAEEPRS
jgi:5-methyltetrahydropteroyltriglutamate--homocysteine methyltransferase